MCVLLLQQFWAPKLGFGAVIQLHLCLEHMDSGAHGFLSQSASPDGWKNSLRIAEFTPPVGLSTQIEFIMA